MIIGKKIGDQMKLNSTQKSTALEIGFRSSDPDGSLTTIDLIGVPGEISRNGELKPSEQTLKFFDDSIVKPTFSRSRRLADCKFEHLKIWLYDTETLDDERGYEVPKILVPPDIEISSTIHSSKLEKIYVLDNELKGRELERWSRTAEQLFTPLFRKFIPPPQLPEELAHNPLIKLIEIFSNANIDNLDKHGEMKQNLFFNALIIQID